jgi:hypothetical protein
VITSTDPRLLRWGALSLAVAGLIAAPIARSTPARPIPLVSEHGAGQMHLPGDRSPQAVQAAAQLDPVIQGEPKNELPFTRRATPTG